MDTTECILDFFSRSARMPLRRDAEANLLDLRYLDEGVLDSLGLVTMIAEFESAFKISFSADELQSPEFQTIGGLIEIVDRLRVSQR